MRVKSIVVFLASTFGVLFGITSLVSAGTYGSGKYGNCDYGYESGCSIGITTSGLVNLSVLPVSGGNTTIASDTVTVSTNSLGGYTLTFANSSVSESALLSGSNTIAAQSASAASPSALTTNSWGWRIDGLAGFGAGPTTATENNPTVTDLFAGVPLAGSPFEIRENLTGAVSGEETTVWYGVRADTSQPSGTYTATVIYTATPNP